MRLVLLAVVLLGALALLGGRGVDAVGEGDPCEPGPHRLQDVNGRCKFTLVGRVPRGTTITLESYSTAGLDVFFTTVASNVYGITNLGNSQSQRICFRGPGLEPTFRYAFDGLEQGTITSTTTGGSNCFHGGAWFGLGVTSISVYK